MFYSTKLASIPKRILVVRQNTRRKRERFAKILIETYKRTH